MTSTWLDVFGSGLPPSVSPVTVATLVYVPGAVRILVHVYVVDCPGATGLKPGPPEIVPFSQFASTNSLNVSGTVLLLVTTIS